METTVIIFVDWFGEENKYLLLCKSLKHGGSQPTNNREANQGTIQDTLDGTETVKFEE